MPGPEASDRFWAKPCDWAEPDGESREMMVYVAGLFVASLLYLSIVGMSLTRRGVARVLMIVTATAIFGAWLIFLTLSWTGYQDADGFTDCGDSCTGLQNATGGTLFYGLAALGLLVVVSFILSVVRFLRSRREAEALRGGERSSRG